MVLSMRIPGTARDTRPLNETKVTECFYFLLDNMHRTAVRSKRYKKININIMLFPFSALLFFYFV